MKISAIVPIYNGRDFLGRSLPPLVEQLSRGELTELLVVDDGSTDDSATLAERLGARVIRMPARKGPAAARNFAAAKAAGDVLCFVDADVAVHQDAARQIHHGLAQDNVAAIFGSYDDQPVAKNFLSQYKNLVHHHYHQTGRKNATSFWAGCGAIRRAVFLELGGFDAGRFDRPSIEDIELGYRLREAGKQVRLLPELQGTHLKHWRLANLLLTDVLRRALPWSRLMLERNDLVDDLNVSRGERLRAVVALLAVVDALLVVLGLAPWWTIVLWLGLAVLVNLRLFNLFRRRRGTFFGVMGILFHQIYYIYGSAAFVWCWLVHMGRSLGRWNRGNKVSL